MNKNKDKDYKNFRKARKINMDELREKLEEAIEMNDLFLMSLRSHVEYNRKHNSYIDANRDMLRSKVNEIKAASDKLKDNIEMLKRSEEGLTAEACLMIRLQFYKISDVINNIEDALKKLEQ